MKRQRKCLKCRKVPATVGNRFCADCWQLILTEFAHVWEDVLLTQKELEELVMSFFVDA